MFDSLRKKDNCVLHPARYRVQRALERVMLEDPKQLSKMLMESGSVRIHVGAAVSIQYALEYVDKVKAEIGDDMLGCFIFGGVARGLKTDRRPKDIDVMILTKRGKNTTKVRSHPRISSMLFDEDMVSPEIMLQDNEQSSFLRRTFSLPILVLHGHEYVGNLRDHATKFLKVKDLRAYIDFQVKKKIKEMGMENQKIDDIGIIRAQVMEDLDIMHELRDLL